MSSQDNRYLENGDWHRTFYINTLSVGTNKFDLDAENRETTRSLRPSRQQHYFDCYDANYPENRPLNRPPD